MLCSLISKWVYMKHLIKFRYNHEFPTIVLWVDLSSVCSRSFSPLSTGQSSLASSVMYGRCCRRIFSQRAWGGLVMIRVGLGWFCFQVCMNLCCFLQNPRGFMIIMKSLSVRLLASSHPSSFGSPLCTVYRYGQASDSEKKQQQQQHCSAKCLRSARSSFEEGNIRCVFSVQKLKLKFVFKSSGHRGV